MLVIKESNVLFALLRWVQRLEYLTRQVFAHVAAWLALYYQGSWSFLLTQSLRLREHGLRLCHIQRSRYELVAVWLVRVGVHLILHRLLLRGSDVVLSGRSLVTTARIVVSILVLGLGDTEGSLLGLGVSSYVCHDILSLVFLNLPLFHHWALGVLHVRWLVRWKESLSHWGLVTAALA